MIIFMKRLCLLVFLLSCLPSVSLAFQNACRSLYTETVKAQKDCLRYRDLADEPYSLSHTEGALAVVGTGLGFALVGVICSIPPVAVIGLGAAIFGALWPSIEQQGPVMLCQISCDHWKKNREELLACMKQEEHKARQALEGALKEELDFLYELEDKKQLRTFQVEMIQAEEGAQKQAEQAEEGYQQSDDFRQRSRYRGSTYRRQLLESKRVEFKQEALGLLETQKKQIDSRFQAVRLALNQKRDRAKQQLSQNLEARWQAADQAEQEAVQALFDGLYDKD